MTKARRVGPAPAAPFAAGIISAGDGTRLSAAFPGEPKPMVRVAGVELCRLVAGSLVEAGAGSLTVILNTRGGPRTSACLEAAFPGVSWRFIVRDTASSWESFRRVAEALSDQPDFLMSTVDALIPPAAVARFAAGMRRRGAASGLGLTDFIDDEKPLWADLGPDGCVSALGESCTARRLATAGLYYLTGARARALPPARAYASLRRWWEAEVSAGGVAGACLGKAVDVDRPQDLAEAERFAREELAPRRSRRLTTP